MKRRRPLFWAGVGAGLLNGMLGAGGGLIAVPALEKNGCTGKQSHATALGMMVPLSAVSGGYYLWKGWTDWNSLLPVMVPCLAGAWLGGWLFRRIGKGWLKVLFAVFLGWGGIRNLLAVL